MTLNESKNSNLDSHGRKFLGRNKESWIKLIAFYIALYTCLAAIWSLYFHIFHLTISDRYPKWQLDESLIGSNPGLGIRPKSPASKVESALISYKAGLNGSYQYWVDDISAYLRSLEEPAPGDGSSRGGLKKENCRINNTGSGSLLNRVEDSYCPFDNGSIPIECSAASNYSFPAGQPCILIKLNRIFGWLPQPYEYAPIDFPAAANFKKGFIAISCEGQHDSDKEHLGDVKYYPEFGIDPKYYPFLNQPGYQSPFVMAHFVNPKPNTLIYVECKAWAKNIEHDRYNRKGMALFELFIEKEQGGA